MPTEPEIGGYNVTTDWPKMGPSLLIATALILAIRTAKWPATFNEKTSNPELNDEIEYAAHLCKPGDVISGSEARGSVSSEAGAVVSGD